MDDADRAAEIEARREERDRKRREAEKRGDWNKPPMPSWFGGNPSSFLPHGW